MTSSLSLSLSLSPLAHSITPRHLRSVLYPAEAFTSCFQYPQGVLTLSREHPLLTLTHHHFPGLLISVMYVPVILEPSFHLFPVSHYLPGTLTIFKANKELSATRLHSTLITPFPAPLRNSHALQQRPLGTYIPTYPHRRLL